MSFEFPSAPPAETLPEEEKPVGVSKEQLEAYGSWDLHGPKVGEVRIVDKETGEDIAVSVHVDREGRKKLSYSLCLPSGEKVGYTWLEEYGPSEIDKFAEEHKPRAQYGNETEKTPSKVFVDQMESYSRGRYKGVGQALHQIAVERSFQVGAEGRVQLVVGGIGEGMAHRETTPGTSAGFHESFGFLGQDVYTEEGELHHPGQRINEDLAKSRWRRAEMHKRVHGTPPSSDVHDSVEYWERDKPFMYLPPEAIEKEQRRIEEHPIFSANLDTVEALLEKHEVLRKEAAKRGKAQQLVDYYEKAQSQLDANECAKIAELYEDGKDSEKATEYYTKAADLHALEAARSNHFADSAEAATFYAKAGLQEKARQYWQEAAERAEQVSEGRALHYAEQYRARMEKST